MLKISKKMKEARKYVDVFKTYDVAEAIALLKKISFTKFDPTVEIAIKTYANPKYNDQMMRGTISLPYGT
jgi:large subunit ribosomal protein L1